MNPSTPSTPSIPYSRQSIDDEDIEAVMQVLKSDWLTTGPAVTEFEEALAERVQVRHAVAFANGTAALHGALVAAEVGPGDTVATSPLSFAASAACARYVGAEPVYVDIDLDTLNLDPLAVPAGVAALVAVHFSGLPVDLTRLNDRPPVVIEDAAQALGAVTPSGPVGNCAHSDMCTFSFHPVKTITTGEGGAVTTNSDALAEALRRFRHQGIDRSYDGPPWETCIPEPGFNYRLTDIQAALGTSQLKRLSRFLARREEIARRYDAALEDLDAIAAPGAADGVTHARNLYPILVEDRRAVYEGMHDRGIGVQVHHVPIYRHPAYRGRARIEDFPMTEAAYAHALSLPLFTDLTDDEQTRTIEALRASL